MATSRKIDAAFFDQKWVDALVEAGDAAYVLLFLYLIVTCRNPVGIFEVNARLWNFKLNPPTPFKGEEVFTKFGKRIRRIEGHPDKGIIVGFCDYQRNFGEASKQWAWVVKDLEAVGLTYEALKQMDADAVQPEFDLGQPPPSLKAVKPKAEPQQRNVIPPKREWVAEYCSTRNNGIDPDAFYSWAESKGWKVGNQPMKDWQAAIRTWEARRKAEAAPAPVQERATSPVRNVVGTVRRKF